VVYTDECPSIAARLGSSFGKYYSSHLLCTWHKAKNFESEASGIADQLLASKMKISTHSETIFEAQQTVSLFLEAAKGDKISAQSLCYYLKQFKKIKRWCKAYSKVHITQGVSTTLV